MQHTDLLLISVASVAKKTDTTSLTGVDLGKPGQSEPGGSCGLAEVFNHHSAFTLALKL